MSTIVESVLFRGILDSRGKTTIEAELRSEVSELGSLDDAPPLRDIAASLTGTRWESQAEFDAALAAGHGS